MPVTNVEEVRQIKKRKNNVSENIINDLRTEAKCHFFVESIGTTRFQIQRTTLLDGYKWVTTRPAKIQKTLDES